VLFRSVLPDNSQQTPAPQLKTSQPSLVGPKTVKSEWCIQNTKREDEDCFSGSSQNRDAARLQANRIAREAGHSWKRAETGIDQIPYYAVYATQPLNKYEKNNSKTTQGQQATTTQPAAATTTNTTV
jgi:hypothetical protein